MARPKLVRLQQKIHNLFNCFDNAVATAVAEITSDLLQVKWKLTKLNKTH